MSAAHKPGPQQPQQPATTTTVAASYPLLQRGVRNSLATVSPQQSATARNTLCNKGATARNSLRNRARNSRNSPLRGGETVAPPSRASHHTRANSPHAFAYGSRLRAVPRCSPPVPSRPAALKPTSRITQTANQHHPGVTASTARVMHRQDYGNPYQSGQTTTGRAVQAITMGLEDVSRASEGRSGSLLTGPAAAQVKQRSACIDEAQRTAIR
jgi:hypothetical protein